MIRLCAGIGVLTTLAVVLLLGSNVAGIGAETFRHLGYNSRFTQALLFSLMTSAGATACAFMCGVPAALWLSRSTHWSSRLCAIILELPLVIPPLITGVLILKVSGNALMREWINLVFTLQGALVAQFFVALPLMIKSAESALSLVDHQYEHLAMTMGAAPVRAFMDTTWRLAWPGIMAGVLMAWLRALGEFGATLMVGGGIPGKTENIPIFIYLSISEGDFSAGMGACVLLLFTVLLVLVGMRLGMSDRRSRMDV